MARTAQMVAIALFCLIAVLLVHTASAATGTFTAGTFSSASDLDLTGTFIAAENENGPAITVGGVNFTTGAVSSYFNPAGGSASGVAAISGAPLQTLMSTLGFLPGTSAGSPMFANFSVTPGTNYQLQLLFINESDTNFDPWDITGQGTDSLLGFQPITGGAGPGQVVTYDFTATGSTVNISIFSEGGIHAGEDGNTVYLNAFTLEETLPEPASLSLLLLGGAALFRRSLRRQR